MTERQALKLSGLDDEARRGLADMGFEEEQIEAAVEASAGQGFNKALQILLSSMGVSGDSRKRKAENPKGANPAKAKQDSGKKVKQEAKIPSDASSQSKPKNLDGGKGAEKEADELESVWIESIEDEAVDAVHPSSSSKAVRKDKKVSPKSPASSKLENIKAGIKSAAKPVGKVGGSGSQAGAKEGKVAPASAAAAGESKKSRIVKPVDSHDLDPSWLGFVPDPNPYSPAPGEEAFLDSSSLQIRSAEALERIETNATMETPDDCKAKKGVKMSKLSRLILKSLVFDWDYICKQKKIYKLPRDPNVLQILAQYESSVDKTYSDEMKTCDRRRFSASMREYFECYCRSHLLYDDRERRQFDRVVKDDRFDSCLDFYGGEHLLRLVVRLPELVPGGLPESTTKEFLWGHGDFLRFLDKNMVYLMENGESAVRAT